MYFKTCKVGTLNYNIRRVIRRKRTFHAAVNRYVPDTAPCCLVRHMFTAHARSPHYISMALSVHQHPINNVRALKEYLTVSTTYNTMVTTGIYFHRSAKLHTNNE